MQLASKRTTKYKLRTDALSWQFGRANLSSAPGNSKHAREKKARRGGQCSQAKPRLSNVNIKGAPAARPERGQTRPGISPQAGGRGGPQHSA